MDVTCPHCSFSKEVDPAKVPDRPVKVTCPQCKQAFTFEKPAAPVEPVVPAPDPAPATEQQTNCPACGLKQPAGLSCQGCGVVYAKWQTRQQQAAEGAATDDQLQKEVLLQTLRQNMQEPAPANQPKAGFWIRFVGYLIDGGIVGIVQMLLGVLLGFILSAMGGLSDEGQTAISVVSGLLGIAISLGYGVFFIGYCGQTPGKMVVRIKVIRTDGAELGYGRAFLREVVGKFISGILLCIGYLMVAFDSRKQGLHDKIADTYVIKL